MGDTNEGVIPPCPFNTLQRDIVFMVFYFLAVVCPPTAAQYHIPMLY